MALVYGRPDLARASAARGGAAIRRRRRAALVASADRARRADAILRRFSLAAAGRRATMSRRPAIHRFSMPWHRICIPRRWRHKNKSATNCPRSRSKSDSLYGHCLRAIDHGLRFGEHGLPLMGSGDWNDGMSEVGVGGKGESVWAAWFLITILERFAPIADSRGDVARASELRARADRIAPHGRARRRGTGHGIAAPISTTARRSVPRKTTLARSIRSRKPGRSSPAPNPERSKIAMQSLQERLVRPRRQTRCCCFGRRSTTPRWNPGYIKGYVPGVRENGGQYTHAALWVVQAFAQMGEGDRAIELFDLLNPIRHATDQRAAEKYRVEPYVVAADVYSLPPHTGRGGWTWYTGSAAWMYRVGLESLLGFHLHGNSLRIEPCVPKDWPGFEITFRHGETTYQIVVENPTHVQTGVRSVSLDGNACPAAEIHLASDGKDSPSVGDNGIADDGMSSALAPSNVRLACGDTGTLTSATWTFAPMRFRECCSRGRCAGDQVSSVSSVPSFCSMQSTGLRLPRASGTKLSSPRNVAHAAGQTNSFA